MKYLKKFNESSEYDAFKGSEDYILPNVSYIVASDTVMYGISKTEEGKYKVILVSRKDISGLTYNEVDLGLPSGRKWADRNVGATNPESYGTYFAWGETEGFTYEGAKNVTAEQLCSMLQPLIGPEMELTPDNIDFILPEMGIEGTDLSVLGVGFTSEKAFSSDCSDYFDTTDGGSTFNKYATNKLTGLEASDDAARVNMGSDWRMPTKAEMQELIDNTTATFIDLQGNEFSQSEAQSGAIAEYNLKGVRFTGSNGNSIFIPASGFCNESAFGGAGVSCFLWSSGLSSSNSRHAMDLYFDYGGYLDIDDDNRCCGQPVRGVK